jgi:hypothetical protein
MHLNRNLTRAAATGGVLLFSMGISGPVSAHETGSTGTGVHADHRTGDHKATLAEMKTWVDGAVASRLLHLDRVAARVAASDRLSAEQKAAWNESIEARRTALRELQSQVAAANTKQEIRAALREAKLLHGCHGWMRHHAKGHDDRR